MRTSQLPAAAAIACACLLLGAANVVTSQYDNARTGAVTTETVLTPRNVNPHDFGRLGALTVDGDVYAQPLIARVDLPARGARTLVFVATEHDSMYAFDAANAGGNPIWHRSFIDPSHGVTTVPSRELACPFIRPEVGITPTPVLDPATDTLYVLARTREQTGATVRYVQRLHALESRTGLDKPGSPVVVQASAAGRGAGSVRGTVTFDPLRQNPRASLLLDHHLVYLSWASSCDVGPYHGWVIAYDAGSLAHVATFVSSPDADDAGVWQSDTGPAADARGDVFVVTGNGAYDAAPGRGRDFGNSAIRLRVSGGAFDAVDWFTPSDQARLDVEDFDLGSGGPLLVPDQPGPHQHVLVAGGKGGTLYVLDRDAMGKFQPDHDRHALQAIRLDGGIYGAPAFWRGSVYAIAAGDALRRFTLRDGRLAAAERSAETFVDPGATPTVSANGTSDGIVWAVQTRAFRGADRPAILRAFDAADVRRTLYDSEMDAARDRAGTAVRFVIPVVAGGRVYVGVKGEVDVYGLLGARG